MDVVVTAKENQTEDIVVLTLVSAKQEELPEFTAGAHIDVHITEDIVRQYSLCGVPGEKGFYTLGILNDPNSRGGSRAVHETIKVGDRLTISEPRNLFPLDMHAQESLLIGGGIGITPMIAMAYALKAARKKFTLHYCVRSERQAAFLPELRSAFGEAVVLHCDDLSDEQKLQPERDFTEVCATKHLYVCGPSGFMDWVMDSARGVGYADSNIHCEYFSAEVDSSGGSFTVVAEQSGKTVVVAEGQSIYQALADAGIKVEISCEQGVCGTCILDVLEGVPDHRDHFLTDQEKADNDQIAVCCSRSKSEVLVLDI